MSRLFKSFILLTGIPLLMAGCAKEESLTSAELGGEHTTVTFTALMDGGTATKATADNDGNAASINRCIMEIYYGDALFTRMYSYVNDKEVTFTTQLVANRTYTVAFWADHVDDPTTPDGLATDLYYTTDGDDGLKAVSIKGDYTGNDDARDAFAFSGKFSVAQGGSTFAATLKRPFSQINVITTDVATVKTVDNLKPENVNLTIKNAVTSYNVLDSTAVSGATDDLTYTASVYKWDDTKLECTLSMDYIFAEKTKGVIDIDWKATKANNADVSHTFSNIPYQRNYRTNIKGALLTATGQWDVTVDPVWNTDASGVFDVIVLVASTVEDVQDIIESYAGEYSVDKTVEIQVKGEISDNTTLYIPDNTTTPNWVFKIENMTQNGTISVEDQSPANNEVNYKMSAEVALPSGIKASQVTFNTPDAHGVVSGDFGRIDATTDAKTLEVKADATVDEIYVHKGNVALYGTVGSIKRGENNTADVIVNVYDGAVWTDWKNDKASTGIKPVVNLGTYTFDPTGYNVEGSTVFANTGSSPATWTVSVTDEWQYYAAKEFSNVSGTTITIMNAAELALFAKNVNADVNYTGYTVQLGADISLSAHEWTPIMLDEGCATNLTFDGAGRTISGLWINKRMASNSALFGTYFSHGTVIKDLVLKNPVVSQVQDPDKTAQEVGLNYTAALVAHMGCGVVDNCTVIDGTINGQDQVGALVGYVACGDVKNCTVEHCLVDAEVGRAGGLVGKVNTDSEYEISNNTVRRTSVSAGQKFDGMLSAAALVGQIMTGSGDTWYIKDNTIENVMTETDGDNTFVPVGEFRKGYFKADAFTGGHIVNNIWDEACADTDRYDMVNPENTSESVTIWNGTPVVWTAYAASSFSSIDEGNKIINITTAAELALFSRKYSSYEGYTAKLNADIDLSAHYWEPFKGVNTIDGANHTIDGLTIEDYGSHNGFISTAYNEIKDIKFTNASVKGVRAAVVAGAAAQSTFTNVAVENATVEGEQKCGGIIGFIGGVDNFGATYTRISGCSVKNLVMKASTTYDTDPESDVNGASFGGLVGFASPQNEITVTNCSVNNISFSGILDASWYSDKNALYYQYLSHPFIGALITKESAANKGKGYESQVYTLTGNTVAGTITTAQTAPCETSNAFLGFYYNDNIQPKATSQKTKLIIDGTVIPTDLSNQ